MYEHLINKSNSVWLMEPARAESLFSVLNNRANSVESVIAIESNTPFAQANSTPFNVENGVVNGEKVAYLQIMGTLVPRTGSMRPYCGMFPTNSIIENLSQWTEGVDKVIFHIGSGGGFGGGIREVAQMINDLPMKTVAYVDDMCCSAAYWIASACNEIIALPSATVGHIGSYIAVTKKTAVGRENSMYSTTYIAKGSKKVFGNPETELSPEELSYFEEKVTASFEAFVSDVAQYRNLSKESVIELESAYFLAGDVVGTLVDKLGTLQEVVNGSI